MVCNVGTADRAIRFIAGLIIVGLGFYYSSWWGALGVIPLFTATTRWCPAYLPFGFSSAKK